MSDLITISPDQLGETAAADGADFALVFAEGGPLQKLRFTRLLAKLLATDLCKATVALLNADLAHDADAVALVFNDPIAASNGWYRKTGASGTGAWTQFEVLTKTALEVLDDIKARALVLPAGDPANGALPDVASRATKYLGFDVAGNPLALPGTADGGALQVLLAADGGAALVGTAGGVTVQAKITDTDAAIASLTASAAQAVKYAPAATRAALAAIASPALGSKCFLYEGVPLLVCRSGWFTFSTADLSAEVTADTLQGLYVAPGGDPTGASGAWVRDTDGVVLPEYFGAIVGDGAAPVRTANLAALNAAVALSQNVRLSAGAYYTDGEWRVSQSYRRIEGAGRDKTAISSNHATAHVMNVGGVVGSYYVERPHISGMTLHRSVGATVGATVADDLLQGHGLHIRMISNAVVREVDTSGNLIGTYWANALSPLWEDCFDYMSGFGARCYSFYLDGEASDAMGTGFPSLIVFRGEKIRQTNAGAAALSYGMKVKGQYTDMWVNGVETAGVHKGLHLDGNGTNAHFNSHCHDSYKGDGALIDYVGEGNNITFLDFYAAPGVGATGQPITVNNGRNIQFIGTQISSYPGGGDGKIGALFNNCVGCRIEGNIVNHSTGVKFDTCYGSAADVDVVKFTGTGVAAIESAGGYGNRLAAGVVGVTGAVNYAVGVKLSVSGGNTVDLTRVLDSAVTDRLTIDAAAVADGGTVIGDNHVIRPGAQPILASGTYTPTLTNGVNVAGSAAYAGQWSRVGDIVTVAGHIDVAPTSAGASTIMGISLPVASNLGAIADCNGSFGSDGEVGCSGAIYGDVANDRATLGYIAPSVTARGLFYSFSYRVI